MIVNSIELKNFRNHEHTKLNFCDKFNIIFGDNGQGKTNILEALYFCASGRSHRTSRDAELIKFGQDGFHICTCFNNSGLDRAIEIKFFSNQKKQIRINEIPIKKMGSLMGNLYAIIFSPEDLLIIKQGPGERRRFVDITLSQIKPSYFFELQNLSKILKQRNSLLKNLSQYNNLKDTVSVWDYKLAQCAATIIIERKLFADKLSDLAAKQHKFLSDDLELISFNYDSSFDFGQIYERNHIIDIYLNYLEKCLQRDIATGYTNYGPHRDDYDILINNKSIKQFGSQGQQRSAVLSLKIAEIELIHKETGEMPILLLDDVMSELDDSRQKYLLNSIKGVQTFITCTNGEQFVDVAGKCSKFFRVLNGNIVE